MPLLLLDGTWPCGCVARGLRVPRSGDPLRLRDAGRAPAPGLEPGRLARALQRFRSTSKAGRAIWISSEEWDATWKNNLLVPPGNIVCSLAVQTHQH